MISRHESVNKRTLTLSIEVTLWFYFSSVFSKYVELFSGDFALELTDFHIIDENTAADVHKLKVHQENQLEITGTLITNAPVTAESFTATVRLNLNGKRYMLGMPFIVNQPVDCPDSLTSSSSDPKQWYVHVDTNKHSWVHFRLARGR